MHPSRAIFESSIPLLETTPDQWVGQAELKQSKIEKLQSERTVQQKDKAVLQRVNNDLHLETGERVKENAQLKDEIDSLKSRLSEAERTNKSLEGVKFCAMLDEDEHLISKFLFDGSGCGHILQVDCVRQ